MDQTEGSVDDLIRLKGVCKLLTDLADSVAKEPNIELAAPSFKKLAVAVMHIKSTNRRIYEAAENKRKLVEAQKEKVEMLKLKLENFLYKQAYLQREIRICQDLSTPNLHAVENEIGRPLAALEYTTGEDLSDAESAAKDALAAELIAREESVVQLNTLKCNLQSREEVLDKKRKFIDDLPARVAALKTATGDLQGQFDAVAKIT